MRELIDAPRTRAGGGRSGRETEASSRCVALPLVFELVRGGVIVETKE